MPWRVPPRRVAEPRWIRRMEKLCPPARAKTPPPPMRGRTKPSRSPRRTARESARRLPALGRSPPTIHLPGGHPRPPERRRLPPERRAGKAVPRRGSRGRAPLLARPRSPRGFRYNSLAPFRLPRNQASHLRAVPPMRAPRARKAPNCGCGRSRKSPGRLRFRLERAPPRHGECWFLGTGSEPARPELHGITGRPATPNPRLPKPFTGAAAGFPSS